MKTKTVGIGSEFLIVKIACPHCKKHTSVKVTYKEAYRFDADKKWYMCDACGKEFACSVNLVECTVDVDKFIYKQVGK